MPSILHLISIIILIVFMFIIWLFSLIACFSSNSIIQPIGFFIHGIILLIAGIYKNVTFITILGLFLILISPVLFVLYVINEKDGTNIKKQEAEKLAKLNELDEINREYQEAIASQKSNTPWTVKYATEPCPYCGHYKVRSAKWDDKKMSVAFWGAASGKFGKSFKCDHCKQMW